MYTTSRDKRSKNSLESAQYPDKCPISQPLTEEFYRKSNPDQVNSGPAGIRTRIIGSGGLGDNPLHYGPLTFVSNIPEEFPALIFVFLVLNANGEGTINYSKYAISPF